MYTVYDVAEITIYVYFKIWKLLHGEITHLYALLYIVREDVSILYCSLLFCHSHQQWYLGLKCVWVFQT